MLKLSGKTVYKGIAFGKIIVLKKKEHQVKREKIVREMQLSEKRYH